MNDEEKNKVIDAVKTITEAIVKIIVDKIEGTNKIDKDK